MEFCKKPLALITASTSGFKGNASIVGTLLMIESRLTTDTQLVIPAIKTKVKEDGKITDDETLNKVNLLIQSLSGIVRGVVQNYLPVPGMH